MSSSRRLALAVDLGTTTLAASLVDPATGDRLARAGCLNPQRQFGGDVVSRMEAALHNHKALAAMQALVGKELERLARELLDGIGAFGDDLSRVAIAANPAMEHILLGLPVKKLALPPHRPLFAFGREEWTTSLGWEMQRHAFLFPLPGGFVGGDAVAFLYGCMTDASAGSTQRAARLFLDLGTNAEIVLRTESGLLATAAAAGPAFEGGNLSCGMAALPGAISRVAIDGDRVTLDTIGGGTPVGICGSAVIDTLSGLLETGVIDASGRLLSPGEIASNLANRILDLDGEPAFLLYRDARTRVAITQGDIRQVQLAKAAIRAGIEVLCNRAGISSGDLEEVTLTGSFGAVLAPEGLKNVGILPEKVVQKCGFVPDGVLAGVEKCLCTPSGERQVDELSASLRVIPLSGTPAFEKHFLEQMNFPART